MSWASRKEPVWVLGYSRHSCHTEVLIVWVRELVGHRIEPVGHMQEPYEWKEHHRKLFQRDHSP